jgi:apolipoprotein N-acyltransferase
VTSNRRRSLLSILVVAISAIAFLVSTGVGVVWPLAWLAPIPVLVLAVHRSWRAAAVVAFTASLLGDLTLARTYGPGAVLIFGIPPAMAFAAATLAARAAARRMVPWLAVFAFPTVLTSYEFLFSLISPNGTFWSLGYSQTDFLPLLQVVSLTGLWGVVFVLTLVPSAVALVLYRRSLSSLIPALAILLLVLGYGTWRLLHAPEPPIVREALEKSGAPQGSELIHAKDDRVLREFGTSQCLAIYLDGTRFARVEPVLRRLPIGQNARVVIRHGKQNLNPREVRMPRQ